MPTPGKPSFSDRVHRQLVKVFGPAQLSPVGERRPTTQDPGAGVAGSWEVRRSGGRTFIVPADGRPATPSAPAPPEDRAGTA